MYHFLHTNKFVMQEYSEKKDILEDKCNSSELAFLKVNKKQGTDCLGLAQRASLAPRRQ